MACVTGRQLALDLAPGRRRRELVELVEQARDLVGPVGIEVDGVVGLGSQKQEAELLGRDDLGDRVRRGAAALGGRHLLAADVEELVGHVDRRLALEHLAGDRVATGRASRRPWTGPCRRVRWSRRTATTGPPIRDSTAAWPRHRTARSSRSCRSRSPTRRARPGTRYRPASPSQSVTIVVPTLPQFGQMTPAGCQRVGMLDVGDPTVDVADERGAVQRGPEVRVHRPGRVDVAHPVVAVGVDAEAGERIDEDAREVARIRRVAVAGRDRARGRAAGPSRARWRRASGAPGRPSDRGHRRRREAWSRRRWRAARG